MPDFEVSDRFDTASMVALISHPDVFWPAADALSPPPEAYDLEGHLADPNTWTVGGFFRGHLIGYVRFVRRTSVMAEVHCGFLPNFRGLIAKSIVQWAIGAAFQAKGMCRLVAMIPSDNRPAIMLAAQCGFKRDGAIPRSVTRKEGLRDLVIMSLGRKE